MSSWKPFPDRLFLMFQSRLSEGGVSVRESGMIVQPHFLCHISSTIYWMCFIMPQPTLPYMIFISSSFPKYKMNVIPECIKVVIPRAQTPTVPVPCSIMHRQIDTEPDRRFVRARTRAERCRRSRTEGSGEACEPEPFETQFTFTPAILTRQA